MFDDDATYDLAIGPCRTLATVSDWRETIAPTLDTFDLPWQFDLVDDLV